MDYFTNRDVAVIVWTAIPFGVLLFKKKIRTSTLNLIRCAFSPKLLEYYFLFLIYFSLFIYCFYDLGWWNLSNLKDTIIWFVFSGLPIGFFVATNTLKNGFWKNLILKNLKLIVLVEFLIDTFTFPLIVELAIVPITTLVMLTNSYSKFYIKDKDVERITYRILSIITLFVLSYTISRAVIEYSSIENISTLQYFLFPIMYSILSMPYMYIFKLHVEYDKLFGRLKLGRKRSKRLNFLIKLQLLEFCNIQLKRLQIATDMKNYNISLISSEDEIKIMIQRYKKALSQEESHKSE